MNFQSKAVAFILFFLPMTVMLPQAYACDAPFSTTRYLSTAFHDDSLVFQNEKLSFLKSSSSNTPFLNEIEFRMKLNDFESNKPKYAIRLKPNGWGEAINGKKVYDKTLLYNEAHYDLLVNKALKERYTTIIDYFYNKQLIALNEALMILFKDRVDVLKKSVGNLNFDADDLINAENDIIRLELDLINQKNDTVNIEDAILKNLPGAEAFLCGTPRMIDIQEMEDIINKTESITQDNIHLESTRLNAALSKARYELEKSENRKYLSFIEAAYDTDDQDAFEKAFSIQFGISIPIVNPNRLDTNRRKLRILKAQSEYANMHKKVNQERVILSRDVKRLTAQYKVLKLKKHQSNTQSSFDTYRHMEGVSPLILLKLKESLLKTDISMHKILRRIYTKYIKFLNVSGKLSEKPCKNYLSHNLELILP